MSLAVVLFVASILGAGFTFVWKGILLDTQKKYQADLRDNESRFGIDEIERLKRKDLKINFAKQLLKNHLSVSEIFDIVGGLTIDGVRFSSLDYTGPDPKSNSGDSSLAKISMKGIANSFSSIAWQSDVFGRSQKYGTNKVLRNPILSDLSVDAVGNVGFSFTTSIDPKDISYEKVLESDLRSEGLILDTPATTSPDNQGTNP